METKSESLQQIEDQFKGLEGVLDFIPFQPRIFVLTFPKSGTHLANLICAHLAHRQTPKHWLGTFRGHSWSTVWLPSSHILPIIHGQPAGTWYQGHVGYKPEFAEAFIQMGVAVLFIYRDLRDVAVSQAYHIEAADHKNKFHPGKELYMNLPDHKAIIKAVIKGLGDWPGIIERWELYAKWLDEKWILPIRYEDMISDPKRIGKKAVEYVIQRTTDSKMYLTFADMISAAIAKAIDNLQTTEYSSSYRKGVSGEWKKEFDQEVIDLFKKHDKNHWIVRLGYEENNDW